MPRIFLKSSQGRLDVVAQACNTIYPEGEAEDQGLKSAWAKARVEKETKAEKA
jgi:hypothetical protein